MALEQARVAHLATHGVLREGAPYSCELTLAGTASLTVPDLVGMRGSVDLAVLSACDSGRGRATAAGDLIGLTRALLSAGVRDLVVSLWPVDDRLACLTMVELHRRLIGGSGVGAALAAAQRQLRVMSATEADVRYRQLGGADEPAAQRTVRSLRDLGDQKPSAEATDDPGHPFYWAPFVHIGTS
jgi:CHAT domain-containing protein